MEEESTSHPWGIRGWDEDLEDLPAGFGESWETGDELAYLWPDEDPTGNGQPREIPRGDIPESARDVPERWLYHLTPLSNLFRALRHGALEPRTALEAHQVPPRDAGSGRATPGDVFDDLAIAALIDQRRAAKVGCYPYQTLDCYVPFYLRRDTPLFWKYRQSRHQLAAVAIRTGALPGPWIVIDRHFTHPEARCAPGPVGLGLVDWEAIDAPYEREPRTNRRYRQQAEVNHYQKVPVECWGAIAVGSETAKRSLPQDGETPQVTVVNFSSWRT